MESNNKILSNQLVVMSRSDLDTMVNEMAQSIVAAQTKNAQSDCEAWMDVPEEERFLTRKETARLLHVCLTTLYRWNNEKRLLFTYPDKATFIKRRDRERMTQEMRDSWNGTIGRPITSLPSASLPDKCR